MTQLMYLQWGLVQQVIEIVAAGAPATDQANLVKADTTSRLTTAKNSSNVFARGGLTSNSGTAGVLRGSGS